MTASDPADAERRSGRTARDDRPQTSREAAGTTARRRFLAVVASLGLAGCLNPDDPTDGMTTATTTTTTATTADPVAEAARTVEEARSAFDATLQRVLDADPPVEQSFVDEVVAEQRRVYEDLVAALEQVPDDRLSELVPPEGEAFAARLREHDVSLRPDPRANPVFGGQADVSGGPPGGGVGETATTTTTTSGQDKLEAILGVVLTVIGIPTGIATIMRSDELVERSLQTLGEAIGEQQWGRVKDLFVDLVQYLADDRFLRKVTGEIGEEAAEQFLKRLASYAVAFVGWLLLAADLLLAVKNNWEDLKC